MNKRISVSLALLLPLVLHLSCGGNKVISNEPPPNRLYADMTVKPLMESEQIAFEGLNTSNRVELKFFPEEELYKAFMLDSTRMIVGSRRLNTEERKSLESRQLVFNETKIATDAIAFIVGNKFPLDNLSRQQLLDIMNGKISSWKQIDARLPDGKLQVVFDHPHSAIIRQLDDSLRTSAQRPEGFFALHSPDEVVEHVEKNENSIGLIGMSWISEHNDTTAGSFLDRIKVLELENPRNHQYFLPLQAYLATRDYPLIREVYVITLGNTVRFPFGSYLTNEKGQRVVLKEGLVPATMPLRLVKIQPE